MTDPEFERLVEERDRCYERWLWAKARELSLAIDRDVNAIQETPDCIRREFPELC
jgi:hypothetical protein